MKKIIIPLYDNDSITVTLEERLGISTGQIDSTLKEDPDDRENDNEQGEKYNYSIQGMLELILSLACMGIDIKDPKFIAGIEGAHTELTEQYCE